MTYEQKNFCYYLNKLGYNLLLINEELFTITSFEQNDKIIVIKGRDISILIKLSSNTQYDNNGDIEEHDHTRNATISQIENCPMIIRTFSKDYSFQQFLVR